MLEELEGSEEEAEVEDGQSVARVPVVRLRIGEVAEASSVVVLPAWEPVVGLGKGGVVVSFVDARVLPWKVNRWYKEEAILVVADRSKTEVAADDGFYLVNYGDGGGLKVERGFTLKEKGFTQSLGTVLVVVRPPKEENDDQLSDEDWE